MNINRIKSEYRSRHTLKRVVIGLLTLNLFLGGFYIYLVRMAVNNVVSRQSVQKELVTLRTKVSELESERVALKNTVTISFAKSLGFVNIENPVYINNPRGPAPDFSLKQ